MKEATITKEPDRPPRVPLIPASILARMTIWLWGFYSIWQGAGILIDGQERFNDPVYAALNRTPEPTLTWGISLVVAGACILTGSIMQTVKGNEQRRLAGFILKGFGCVCLAVWCVTFAIGGLLARDIPSSPGTVARTYISIAVAVLLVLFIDERKAHPSGR
jgi:hypothetical protein